MEAAVSEDTNSRAENDNSGRFSSSKPLTSGMKSSGLFRV